jgi:hypothetical protein
MKKFILFLLALLTIAGNISFLGCTSPATVSITEINQSSTTPESTILPSPTFPDVYGEKTGAIEGKVLFKDGTPAYPCFVFLFSKNGTESIATTGTNRNGEYIFDGIKVSSVGTKQEGEYTVRDIGYYYVYPTINISKQTILYTFSSNAPYERVRVYEHEINVVPDIYIDRP